MRDIWRSRNDATISPGDDILKAIVTSNYPVLVTILCGLGRTDEALKVLSTYVLEVLNTAPESGDPRNNARALLGLILRTYVDQDNDAGVMAALDTCRSPIGLELAPCFYKVMIKFYALRQDTANLEKWFDSFLQRMALSPSRDSMSRQLRVALTCCLKSKQHELGHRFVRSIMKMDPQKPEWDEILVWGFGLQNSIEEINRMMDVMIQSNQDRPKNAIPHIPDIATINRLVRTAIDAQDPYSAERLIALGKERGIEPDAGTLVLQMQYRLSVKDVDGALIAYKHLQSKDLSSRDDWAVTNQLIVTLCTSGRHDYQTIMNVAADLSDRRAKFEAPTVQALAILHLKRDELQDVQDLIKTHARGFSSAERASLRTTITAFCVDPTTPTANMWDAYNILRHEFDEMPREERTQIMQSCFARTRPDIAVHVFNHMRLHSRLDTMPDDSTYTAAFVGTSKVIADPRQRLPSLRALHNQLKLDTNVRTTTRMLNALMIAYTSCDQGDTALDIWDDILESTEGPTLSSIHIALRACESTDFADVKAQDIWARLRKNNIDLDQRLWASYIAALVGNGNVHNAVTTLEEAYRRDEVELDSLMLGSLYNAAILTGKQGLIASWASAEHNEAWKRLQKVGMATNDYFRASYQVDRWVEP